MFRFGPYTAFVPATGLRRTPSDHGLDGRLRRTPVQERSRRRVEAILDAAEPLVVEHGVEALTTRDIAGGRGRTDRLALPVLRRQGGDPARPGRARHPRDGRAGRRRPRPLEELSVAALVETTMRAFVAVYARRPRLRRDLPAWSHQRRPPRIRSRAQPAHRRGAARARASRRPRSRRASRRGRRARRRGRRPSLPAGLRARPRGDTDLIEEGIVAGDLPTSSGTPLARIGAHR